MKVFVVILGDGGQSAEIAGIFSTRKKAEAFVASFPNGPVGHLPSDLSIEEHALDQAKEWAEGLRR